MSFRRISACLLFLAAPGCQGIMFTQLPTIEGRYELVSVDGNALPCCAEADSAGSGAVITIVGGALTLGYAAPEEYGFPPSGVPKARSCIHEIPDGAWLDSQNNVVHLPDGSTYQLPECGDANYTMVLTRRYERPDGSSETVSDTTAGKYTWGNEPGRDPLNGGIISLLASHGLGQVTKSGAGVNLLVQMGVQVGPLPATGRRYEFLGGPR